MRWKTKFR